MTRALDKSNGPFCRLELVVLLRPSLEYVVLHLNTLFHTLHPTASHFTILYYSFVFKGISCLLLSPAVVSS